MRLSLQNVTLIVIDCVDYQRARRSLDYSRKDIDFADVKILTHFEVNDALARYIEPIISIQQYSKFVLRELINHFSTDFVLIAQWDGMVLDVNRWSDEFLNYDYIGAPWTPQTLKPGVPNEFNVGNGGFSIRSKRLQEFLANDPKLVMHEAEDVVICQLNRNYLELRGFTFAPCEVASRFSWETGPERPTFGSHGRHKVVEV